MRTGIALSGLVIGALIGALAFSTTTIVPRTVVRTVTVASPPKTVTVIRTVKVAVPAQSQSCSVYVSGANARLTISGPGAGGQCAALVRANPGGDGWTADRQSVKDAYSDPLSVVCALRSHSNTTVAVYDSGFQLYGTDACNYLEGAGWTSGT